MKSNPRDNKNKSNPKSKAKEGARAEAKGQAPQTQALPHGGAASLAEVTTSAQMPRPLTSAEASAAASAEAGRASRLEARASEDVSGLWLALRSPGQPALWLELARRYAGAGLAWQAGYAGRQAMRLAPDLLPELIKLDRPELGAWRELATGDAMLGRAVLADAAARIERYRQAVMAWPGDWLSWLYLARLQEMPLTQGPQASPAPFDAAAASQALTQAKLLEPLAGESLHWMGVWRLGAGDAAGALKALSGLIDVRPLRSGSMMYLGEVLLQTGNIPAAEKAFSRAALSASPDFLQMLAARVYGHNYWEEAIEVLQKALSLRPGNVPILLAMAKIQSEVYQLAGCRESLRQVSEIEPGNLEANLLGAALKGRMGDAQGHLATLQASYASGVDPLSRVASSIAMTLLYQDDVSAEAIADEHRRVCAPIQAALQPRERFDNSREPERRLRVGYVTGDLHRQHPVNVFMLPVLLRHQHADFDIHIYHTGTMHDEYTRQAKASADRWVEAAKLDDVELQQLVVADGVDILVDLAGHTASHRLGVFAMRGAPVQATFLGYPHSTGLSTIDWLVGDATVSPQAHAHLFSEGLAQLPGSVFCWAPVDAYPLPPPRPPQAPVVFGSFNNAMKLTPRTIGLWAQVLQAVPGSQLLLKAPSLRDASVQARFASLFAAHGIGPERLIMRGPTGLAAMMQEYGDMDIALDPTPYNGGTTSLQALWMGVPVVAMLGHNFVGRMGASFMQTLGQPDWVAADDAAYVAVAVRLAANTAALRTGRARLREQITSTRLGDITTYVADFEALLRQMWRAYCSGQRPGVLRADTPLAA